MCLRHYLAYAFEPALGQMSKSITLEPVVVATSSSPALFFFFFASTSCRPSGFAVLGCDSGGDGGEPQVGETGEAGETGDGGDVGEVGDGGERGRDGGVWLARTLPSRFFRVSGGPAAA